MSNENKAIEVDYAYGGEPKTDIRTYGSEIKIDFGQLPRSVTYNMPDEKYEPWQVASNKMKEVGLDMKTDWGRIDVLLKAEKEVRRAEIEKVRAEIEKVSNSVTAFAKAKLLELQKICEESNARLEKKIEEIGRNEQQ